MGRRVPHGVGSFSRQTIFIYPLLGKTWNTTISKRLNSIPVYHFICLSCFLFVKILTVFSLDVPGLAEKRPSVLVGKFIQCPMHVHADDTIGDQIMAQRPNTANSHSFKGYVHVVTRDNVGLRFHDSFRGHGVFHVHFEMNRIPLRRQHLCMDNIFKQERVLFPSIDHLPGGEFRYLRYNSVSMHMSNPLIETNPAQRQAITSIAYQKPGAIPFLVFGP